MLVPDGDGLCWFQMEIGCVLVPDGDRLCWFQMEIGCVGSRWR